MFLLVCGKTMVESDFVKRDSILCSWLCNATYDAHCIRLVSFFAICSSSSYSYTQAADDTS